MEYRNDMTWNTQVDSEILMYCGVSNHFTGQWSTTNSRMEMLRILVHLHQHLFQVVQIQQQRSMIQHQLLIDGDFVSTSPLHGHLGCFTSNYTTAAGASNSTLVSDPLLGI